MAARWVRVGCGLGLAVAIGPGCRSFNQGGLRRPDPLTPNATADLGIRDQIERHNVAARQVDAVQVVDLAVSVQSYQTESGGTREPFFANTGGVLNVERPKNLRLILTRNVGGEVADIGSNPNEFWMSNAMKREMLVGRYDQIRSDPLAASIQPEWILEVLGLQPIAADASVKAGPKTGTYTITERRSGGPGVEWVKETVMTASTGEIVEHRLLSADRKELLAQASIRGYQEVKVAEVPADSATTPPSISIPRTIELKMPEVADLSLTLRGVKLNPAQKFNPDQFARPANEELGYAIRDIRSMMGPAEGGRYAAEDAKLGPDGPVIEVEGPPARASRRTIRSSDPDPTPTKPVSRRSMFEESAAPRIPTREETSRLWDTPLPSPPERRGVRGGGSDVPGAMREG